MPTPEPVDFVSDRRDHVPAVTRSSTFRQNSHDLYRGAGKRHQLIDSGNLSSTGSCMRIACRCSEWSRAVGNERFRGQFVWLSKTNCRFELVEHFVTTYSWHQPAQCPAFGSPRTPSVRASIDHNVPPGIPPCKQSTGDQPLIQISGSSFATLVDSLASWAALTTVTTSL